MWTWRDSCKPDVFAKGGAVRLAFEARRGHDERVDTPIQIFQEVAMTNLDAEKEKRKQERVEERRAANRAARVEERKKERAAEAAAKKAGK